MSATEKQPNTDDYEIWHALLAGERPAMHEGDVHCGFWMHKGRNGEQIPVAVWRQDDGSLAMLDGSEDVGPNRQYEVFRFCKAISEEAWNDLKDRRDSFDDGSDPIYSDMAGATLSDLEARVGRIADADLSDDHRLADAIHIVRQIEKEVEERKRVAEKPFKDALADVKAEHEGAAKAAAGAKAALIKDAADRLTITGEPHLKGTLGKKIGWVKSRDVEITDLATLLGCLVIRHPEELEAAALKFAKAQMRKGEELPGTTIIEDQRVQ